ncbi:hypothetical protein OIU77_002419 [Salix suchowensis]|nr:hypothetical protein OIU77_002419 [Salix suchowensis]
MGRDHVAAENCNQEKLDELLAASMVVEEEGSDDDEEMILPHGKVDPAVLAALPPSMQLDLLVQMREKLIAENRQRYQKVKKVPEKFSELQIQAYLKTVAFRREINQVQKAAAGNDVGGVQASRIASEANREFIFSSSFSGDKELLTTAGVKRRKGCEQQKEPVKQPSSYFVAGVASICKSNTATGSAQDESSSRSLDDDVETYHDERGRTRVRAMGMCMTRDLQRNLDLMKEIEKEKTVSVNTPSTRSVNNRNKIGATRGFPNENHNGESSHGIDGNSANLNKMNEQSLLSNETSYLKKPVETASAGNSTSRRSADDSASDSDWEEGIVEGKANSSPNDVDLRTNPSLKVSNVSDDSEVEWMEGDSDIHDKSSYPAESKRKPVSKGTLEEEAALQDAIRRSLNDLVVEKFFQSQSSPENIKTSGEYASNDREVECVEVDSDVHDKSSYPAKLRNQVSGGSIEDEAGLQDAIMRSFIDLRSEKSIHSESDPKKKDATQQSKSISEILGFENLGDAGEVNISQAVPYVGSQSKAHNLDDVVMLKNESCESLVHSNSAQISQDVDKRENGCRGMPSLESIGPFGSKEEPLEFGTCF